MAPEDKASNVTGSRKSFGFQDRSTVGTMQKKEYYILVIEDIGGNGCVSKS